MKEIVAFIRPNKMTATKEALDSLGLPSLTAEAVLGRGRQRGISGEVTTPINTAMRAKEKSMGMKFIPKRMLTMIVDDSQVDTIVQTIIKVNQTAQIGDGKIFICPIEGAVRVRTNETGKDALV
jgi:nitrogen regulatory protein PII 2